MYGYSSPDTHLIWIYTLIYFRPSRQENTPKCGELIGCPLTSATKACEKKTQKKHPSPPIKNNKSDRPIFWGWKWEHRYFFVWPNSLMDLKFIPTSHLVLSFAKNNYVQSDTAVLCFWYTNLWCIKIFYNGHYMVSYGHSNFTQTSDWL